MPKEPTNFISNLARGLARQAKLREQNQLRIPSRVVYRVYKARLLKKYQQSD
jgi:hypothetical protein